MKSIGIITVTLSCCFCSCSIFKPTIEQKLAIGVKSNLYKINDLYRINLNLLSERKATTDTLSCQIANVGFQFDNLVSQINLYSKRKVVKQYNSHFYNYLGLTNNYLHDNSEYDLPELINYLKTDIQLNYYHFKSFEQEQSGTMDSVVAKPSLLFVHIKVLDQSNAEIGGYDAFIQPFLSEDKTTIIPFNPTNNAKRNDIVPAWYKVWIEKNGIKIKDKNDIFSVFPESSKIIEFKLP